MSNELTPRSGELSGREIRKFGSTLARVRERALDNTNYYSREREIYKQEPVVIPSPVPLVASEYLEQNIDHTISRLESTSQRRDCEGAVYSYCVISPGGGACVFSDNKWREVFVNIGGKHLPALSEIADSQRRVIERDNNSTDERAIAIIGRTALFSGFTGIEAAYRLFPSEPALLIGAASLIAGGAIGATAVGVGDYFAQKVHYRRLSRKFGDAMEGVFADLKQDRDTLRITNMPFPLRDALRDQFRDHLLLAPKSPYDFLARLALGAVEVSSPENSHLSYVPLSTELLSRSLSEFRDLIEPVRKWQNTEGELEVANNNARQRRVMGLPTDRRGIDNLIRFCQTQHNEVTAAFNELLGNLESGVAKEIAADKVRRLEATLSKIAVTPTYMLNTFSALHDTAFKACLQEMDKLTEDDIEDIWRWIEKAYAVTDQFAETTNYYRAFYEEFRGTLPQLPTPEEFATRYPEIATGLER